jgi:hypothetical protein
MLFTFFLLIKDLIGHIEMFTKCFKGWIDSEFEVCGAKNSFSQRKSDGNPMIQFFVGASAIVTALPERDFPKVSPNPSKSHQHPQNLVNIPSSFGPSRWVEGKLRTLDRVEAAPHGLLHPVGNQCRCLCGIFRWGLYQAGGGAHGAHGAPGWKWCWWISTGQKSLHIFVLVWIM